MDRFKTYINSISYPMLCDRWGQKRSAPNARSFVESIIQAQYETVWLSKVKSVLDVVVGFSG